MPLKFFRTNKTQNLISDTNARVREEISGMSDFELESHLESVRSQHDICKSIGDSDSKILFHELKIIRAEHKKRVNAMNAKLAKKFLKLQLNKKIKCPHCGARIHLDLI